MDEQRIRSVADVDAQILSTHAASRRMRRIVLVGSLLIYLTVDSLNQIYFDLRPLVFHIAMDGLFALALGVSVLFVFRQHDAKQLTALHAAMVERRARDQLAIRLATVQETARAVAHELNQPLASIRGYAELIQTAPPGESIQAELAGILTATDRAATLARDLFHITRYTTQAATDGRPMLNVQESVERPTLME